jgi:hypothetical protein
VSSMDRDDEDFETDRTAYIAFFSSAIAGFKPQKAKYKSAIEYAEEVGEFAQAVADQAFARYKAAEVDGFPFDDLEEEEEEEEERDENDERSRRRRRA